MRFTNLPLALLALGLAVIAQDPNPGSNAIPSASIRSSRPSLKTSASRRPSNTPVPTKRPAPPGPPGLTTIAYVTATIINQVEVISICSNSGATTTVLQESSTCKTYTTCITIPASLCESFVSTQDNGLLTTCTTPVETWTQILTTVQTVTASAATAVSPAAYSPGQPGISGLPGGLGISGSPGQLGSSGQPGSPVQPNTAGAGSQTMGTGRAGAQGTSPASDSPKAAQTTYVTAGASRFVASSLALGVFFVFFFALL